MTNSSELEKVAVEESVTVVTVVEYVYTDVWHWWKEIFGISVLTAVMMNILITRPIMQSLNSALTSRLKIHLRLPACPVFWARRI